MRPSDNMNEATTNALDEYTGQRRTCRSHGNRGEFSSQPVVAIKKTVGGAYHDRDVIVT